MTSTPSGSTILNEFRAAMEARRAGAARPASRPKATHARMYANARPGRFNPTLGRFGNSSADAELSISLATMRAASRQLVRDAPYAKRAKVVVVNNVIGGGVGMQAQTKTSRGELNKRVNDDIEEVWCEWSKATNCHTGGALHFADMERAGMGSVFEAGEALIRLHFRPFGESKVPLALEFIEPERLADDMVQPGPLAEGNEVRMGVEVDGFGRAQAYWIRTRHPGDNLRRPGQPDRYERVDAAEVIHLRVVDRWPQTRGEPWLHTVVRKLDSIEDYSRAELQAAQADAYHFGVIRSATDTAGNPLSQRTKQEEEEGERPYIALENGMVQQLEDGEVLDYHQPKRPNTAIDPFLRYQLREVAAGAGVSYESISRDYSQSNYSSSRLALLEDRDLWRIFQLWWLRNFRQPLHRLWLQQAMLAGAIATVPVEQYMVNRAKFEAVKFKPRGWSWVDPTKEVTAYKEAEKAGYISAEDVIAQTANGLDIEDVAEAMKRSREIFEAAGIKRDTDVAATQAAAAAAAKPPPAPPPDDDTGEEGDDSTTTNDPPRRVVSFAAR